MMILRSVLILILLVNGISWASADPVCARFETLPVGKYCMYPSEGSKNPDILFYLHGAGNNEQSWGESFYYPRQIRDYWQSSGLQPPMVVSISFGPIWLLAEKNASKQSGLFEALVFKGFPEIEKKLGGVKGRRILLGESMGGFNSAQLVLKTDLFKKAALLCAPMADLSPFAKDEEIQAFIEKTTAWQYHKDHDPEAVKESVARMLQILKTFYPDPTAWQKANPLELAKTQDFSGVTGLYLAAGFYDVYALYEGNQEFSEVLKNRGVNLDWRPQWGGHCAIDIPSLAEFLVK